MIIVALLLGLVVGSTYNDKKVSKLSTKEIVEKEHARKH